MTRLGSERTCLASLVRIGHNRRCGWRWRVWLPRCLVKTLAVALVRKTKALDMSQGWPHQPTHHRFWNWPNSTLWATTRLRHRCDGDYTPNAELLKNLNAPGYNPVNEGDYGYEELATEEPTAEEEAPKMASGGSVFDGYSLWLRTTPSVSLRTSWRTWECVSNPQ